MNDVSDTVLNIDGTVNELIKEAYAAEAKEYENSNRSKLNKKINKACKTCTLRTGLIHGLLIHRLLILRLLRSLILGLLIEIVIHNDISLKSYFGNIIIYLTLSVVNYIFTIFPLIHNLRSLDKIVLLKYTNVEYTLEMANEL